MVIRDELFHEGEAVVVLIHNRNLLIRVNVDIVD